MKYYISCSEADHGKINNTDELLNGIGHTCMLRWWRSDENKNKESFEIAFNRVQAIENSDLFICLLPTTRRTAIEMGIALASRYGKRIILWSATGNEFLPEYAGTYCMHPSVTRMSGEFGELLAYLKTL